MSDAEKKVFLINDLRREIFSYVYTLPTCKYCFQTSADNITFVQNPSNDAVCYDCTIALYIYGIEL